MLHPLLVAGFLLQGSPCEGLKALQLPNTTITTAEQIPEGFPADQPGAPQFGLPRPTLLPEGVIPYFATERPPIVTAHCRVVAVIRPVPDSEIGMELWLPSPDRWNGKLFLHGNGGWANSSLTPFGTLNQGYAAAWTDTGHKGGEGAQFALGHPEKVIDFAYRAVHETALKSKAITAAFFNRPARFSYFSGCSTGGRQGLMAAQRYPEDFDGIIAGAPAHNMTGLATWRFSIEVDVRLNRICALSDTKLALVNRAVLDKCDSLDGVADQILRDPRECQFDPTSLLCRTADMTRCLAACEVEALKRAYAPVLRADGSTLFPGLVPGGESRWTMFSTAVEEPGAANDLDLFRYVVYQDAKWNWRTFDPARDSALAEERAGYLNANNPDLSAFKARGGKLILFHGWNDGGNGGAISPLTTVDYFDRVLSHMGPDQSDWLRLYMVPGMAHCGSGPAPDNFNLTGALERWREGAIPPARLDASRVNANRVVDMTRPICPYPQIPVYSGLGGTNDALNFACEAPRARSR